MPREWNLVEVENRIVIPFEWRDPTPGGENLGRAEFVVCIKFRRGAVSEFWVYPVQTRISDYWHWSGKCTSFAFGSYQGLDAPKIWLVRWCDEHKTHSLRVYAPTDAKFICIDYQGLSFSRTNFYD